jgi:hypothetical protein
MDRKSAIDRLYHLCEEKEIAELMLLSATGKMREETKLALEEMVAERKQLHEEFPILGPVLVPTFEVRTMIVTCPKCDCSYLEPLPVADAVQCSHCGYAFSEGLGR